jgi:hypothetical protein
MAVLSLLDLVWPDDSLLLARVFPLLSTWHASPSARVLPMEYQLQLLKYLQLQRSLTATSQCKNPQNETNVNNGQTAETSWTQL